MERLRQALAHGDADTLMLEAHTLKSSSANMGALEFADLAKRFEAAARDGDLVALAGEVNCFERQFATVKAVWKNLSACRDNSSPGKLGAR